MRTLNLGILAHVDAGKTSLTERLLHSAGVIDEIGSVDAGTSHTDFLDLERRRGITLKAAVVSFVVGNVTINLLDTPGHPAFIAEGRACAQRARRSGPGDLRAAHAGDGRPARPPATPRAAHSAHPARRAGPANRLAPRRGQTGAAPLPLRRGAEGGHPGDAGRRVRPRRRVPGDHADLH